MKGYVSAALDIPVHVQNIVVRDYCRRHGYPFELSVTESREGNSAFWRLDKAKPIVAYSLALFTEAMLAQCTEIHFAVEDMQADAHTPMLMRLKRILG